MMLFTFRVSENCAIAIQPIALTAELKQSACGLQMSKGFWIKTPVYSLQLLSNHVNFQGFGLK